MVDLGGLAGKAGEFLKSEKAQEILHGEQAEKISDALLAKGGSAARGVTGGRFDEQIEGVTGTIDKQIGTE